MNYFFFLKKNKNKIIDGVNLFSCALPGMKYTDQGRFRTRPLNHYVTNNIYFFLSHSLRRNNDISFNDVLRNRVRNSSLPTSLQLAIFLAGQANFRKNLYRHIVNILKKCIQDWLEF